MTLTDTVGFIGCGQMAEALIGGLINSNTCEQDKVFACNPSAPRRNLMTEKFGIDTYKDNLEVVKRSKIIVLSVKPHLIDDVLYQIKDHLTEEHLVVSIAAGKTIESMQKIAGDNVRIARLSVNTPALVGSMAGAYSLGSEATDEDAETCQIFMDSIGTGFHVKEDLMDAVTGLAGSGPAYVFMFIEALADGGVKQGIPR